MVIQKITLILGVIGVTIIVTECLKSSVALNSDSTVL